METRRDGSRWIRRPVRETERAAKGGAGRGSSRGDDRARERESTTLPLLISVLCCATCRDHLIYWLPMRCGALCSSRAAWR